MSTSFEGSSNTKRSMSVSDIVECIPTMIKLLSSALSMVPSPTSNSSNISGQSRSGISYRQLHKQIDLLRRSLSYVDSMFIEFERNVNKQFSAIRKQSKVLDELVWKTPRAPDGTWDGTFPSTEFEDSIQTVNERVRKLKLELVPTDESDDVENSEEYSSVVMIRRGDVSGLINELVKEPFTKFQGYSGYETFEEKYESLDSRSKRCLLCLSVFPENGLMEKTFLMYWWIGEGLIDDCDDKPVEHVANGILMEFLDRGFIEPVVKNLRLVGFKMHPLIRCAVVFLAEEFRFFDFDSNWNPTSDFSSSEGACFVAVEDENSPMADIMELNPEKLCRLFNFNEVYLDLEHKWFSKMKSIKVISLGTLDKRGVAVFESNQFLKGFKNMKNLRFLSLRRTMGISEIPKTIKKMTNLRILILDRCSELEALPHSIVHLKNLTHLDVSKCNRLQSMPEGLGSLSKLEVVKGYVVSGLSNCSLNGLAEFGKLKKLSIVIQFDDFDASSYSSCPDIIALSRLEKLKKLTITWRSKNPPRFHDMAKLSFITIPEYPRNLETIELRNYPLATSHTRKVVWELSRLRKVYISGGYLHDLVLGLTANDRLNVRILRLNRLTQMNVDWEVLMREFPSLVYFEKLRCPRLTTFPCDESGMWVNKEKLSEINVGELGLTWSYLPIPTMSR